MSDDPKDSGFSGLSSLSSEVSTEPAINIPPTQAVSNDGTVVQLGENGSNAIKK